MRIVHLLGAAGLDAADKQVVVELYLDELGKTFGSIGRALAAYAACRKLRSRYAPGDVPDDERGPIDDWESAYDRAWEIAFRMWSSVDKDEAKFQFALVYRMRVQSELPGLASDYTQRTIVCREYFVRHEGDHLLFFDADDRGGDITFDRADNVWLDSFPEKPLPADAPLEVIEVIGLL
jgi:hypothetical protein